MSESVPFCRPDVTQAEIDEVVETLRSGWLTTGPRTRRFERQFAERIGCRHAVAVSSCTAGLHLSLAAAGVGPGDEVITTPYTFTASAAAILHAGAAAVLVDVEPDTANLDPDRAERAVTPRTRAILPVHVAGHPCAMDALGDLARRRGLLVVEDAAHALPASHRGLTIGTISPLTAFSFYATKNLTTGEGGMVTTDDDALRERLEVAGYHGMSRDGWRRYEEADSWRYEILREGFKYNMSDLQAALGLVQLGRLDAMQAARRRLVAAYQRAFEGVDGLLTPRERPEVEHAWHLYILRLDPAALRIGRDGFIAELARRGVGASVHFIPLGRHPFYQKRLGVRPQDHPIAEGLFQVSLSLPLYSSMSDDQSARVIEAVLEIAREGRR